jgi:hypothetical protein
MASCRIKDFHGNVKTTAEVVTSLAQLRDTEAAELGKMRAPELKALGKSRGVAFKGNMRKALLTDLMVYHKCCFCFA